jgi:uncharacterized SAM-binding protein YcdF (DUF218 family)
MFGNRVQKISTGLVLLFLVWFVVAWVAAEWLIVDSSLNGEVDAIVVLSGSSAYRERTRLAALLFHQKAAPRIVLTNDGQQGSWSNEKNRNPLTYELAIDELTMLGVPVDRITVLQPIVSSTHDEAVAIQDWSVEKRYRSVVLVTSTYHGRRARWVFNRVMGSSVVKVQLALVAPDRKLLGPSTWWLSSKGWEMVAAEYVKFVVYRIRY